MFNTFLVSAILTAVGIVLTEKPRHMVHVQPTSKQHEPEEDPDEDLKQEETEDFVEDDYEIDSEMYRHLKAFKEIMDALDDGIEKASEKDDSEEASVFYNNFGNYYRTLVPYTELINVSYHMQFPAELKQQLDKFSELTNQFINEFIGDIYAEDSVGFGVQLKYELDEILRLGNNGLESWNGRPTFESVIHKSNKSDSDETQAE